MAFHGKVSEIIQHLRSKLTQVFAENVDGLWDEVGSLRLLTHQEHKDLFTIEGCVERTEKLIDFILQKGEPSCEKFFHHFENMIFKFPALRDFSYCLKGGTFDELVETLKMKPYLPSKLTLRDILNIGLENANDKSPKTVEDHPWNCVRKLMALNRTARDVELETNPSTLITDDLFDESLFQGENNVSNSVHPLDVLCVLLHCSDSFLQQEIISKMAMCQFAVPLLLPAGDGSHCTLMLGAMRDIVKKWRPQSLSGSKGFREENVVNISMPVFSFARLGKNKLSKSKIMNRFLNSAQQHNNFFIHDNMDGGNIERKISDGLVEMSWYFPCGKSDIFPEPIAVTNLRGNLEANWDQFTFLTRVSSAVFIFIESISEEEVRLLSSCPTTDTQYYFIITPGPGKHVSKQTLKALQELSPVLQIKNTNVITYADTSNEAKFVSKLQKSIISLIMDSAKIRKMVDLQNEADSLPIHVDERVPECQVARDAARNITAEIKDIAEYKQITMVLQGKLWKELSKVDKELCRMTNQGGKDAQEYQDELKSKRSSLHEKQYRHDLPHGITLFINEISHLSKTEKSYFLKWLKFELDSMARNHLSKLQAAYKEKCSNNSINKEELMQIDQEISNSSLGIEHFLREMGQFYEAECSMNEENKISYIQRQFTKLPGIAADLLVDGFPLELIDGDASNIPLQWITDVLRELDTKTGKKCRMRVITVLGVQSTGKSTLLNTMFGLQFPVASGRCTRGAFMTLLNVKEDFQEELGCEFIMVIDTEGLKAPELASLEGSYEHDNELATLVVGLSDITILNMAMENTTEMKDILQIVVHAFLRMKEVGKRPNCQFVHQNVSDVSAHDKNMRDRKKLLEQLNEMTKVAAEMEKKSENKTFSDVMDYNLDKDNWYIPGLWLGVPPMAPVNSGYSEHVSELKKSLLELIKNKKSMHAAFTIPQFITWIESLWNAVKYEKFIFSFRNSLVADAYNKLCMQFSQWEWDFRKVVYDWLIRAETNIKNQSTEGLNDELCSGFTDELTRLLLKEKNKMNELLQKYFDNKSENVHLIERYKQDFVLSIESLMEQLKRNTLTKFNEAVSIKKGKFKIQQIQNSSQKLIEGKITNLLEKCREKSQVFSEEELEKEFGEMWEKTLKDLHLHKLERRNVGNSMLQQLIEDMSKKGSAINQNLQDIKDLNHCIKPYFTINNIYIETGWSKWLKDTFNYKKNEPYEKLKVFADSLIRECDTNVQKKVETAEDYNDTYCRELLRMVNKELSQQTEKLRFSLHFELDFKCHILGRASRKFQAIHNKYIVENDPQVSMEKLKPQYLLIFINTFQEKDLSQCKAKEFCDQCLKPAMTEYVFQHLGNKIVDDILHSSDNKTFGSRTFFQSFLLKELLEEMSFEKYIKYIQSYSEYAKNWILSYIEKKYRESQSLKLIQENLNFSMNKRVQEVLASDKCLTRSSVSDFLNCVSEELKSELVIPQKEMNMVIYQNTSAVNQFSSDIQLFLKSTVLEICSELQSMDIQSILTKVTVKPQDELLKKVVGCGKQCPFCKVPCEAGGDNHKHFATIHRSKGLGSYRSTKSGRLSIDICTTSVVSNGTFRNADTDKKYHPYKDYATYYPEWSIQPDPSINCSDYWKFIFVQFNKQFAERYDAVEADLPDGWNTITEENALQSLKKIFND